ncbi:FUSC family protein [Ottowia thiooxydans]|uniref:FUSC family protein n=1 Tax=Ottowia thiooxydans TaxID=219182 RepID=UPI0003FFAF18|nr:FUSC family protein [Ottowia thiooxydans]
MAAPAPESLTARPMPMPSARALLALLRPTPGRLEFAFRLTLVCTLSVAVAEWFHTPEVALTAYVGFFLLRADRTTSIVMGMGMLVMASLLIGLVALIANGLIGRPAALLASMTLIAFGLFFLTSASKLAPVGGILALITTYALSLIGMLPVGELATRALLYAWLMVAIPVGVSTVVNLLIGPAPRRLAQSALARRLWAAAGVLRSGDDESRSELRQLRMEGTGDIQSWLRLASLEHTSPAKTINALGHANEATARVLVLVDTLDPVLPDENARSAIANTLEEMARILDRGAYPVEVQLPALADASLSEQAGRALMALRHALTGFTDANEPAPPNPDPPSGFFAADAFRNPTHVRFAIKATGAAMFCYLFYHALGWNDIHTAFITCFIVALSTTGETVQKLSLRMTGCLVGAAISLAALLWVLPAIEGLAGLLALIFVVTLGATWVAAGSSRISYAGFQIAFAFYLCVLQGNGPSYDFGVARDRVIGILIGNAVMYLVFTRLWPVSVASRIDSALALLLSRLARIAEAPGSRLASVQLASLESGQSAAAADLALLAYEPASVRPSPQWIAQREQTLHTTYALAGPLILQPGNPKLAGVLNTWARQLETAVPTPAVQLPALPSWLRQPLLAVSDAVQKQTDATLPPTEAPHAVR